MAFIEFCIILTLKMKVSLKTLSTNCNSYSYNKIHKKKKSIHNTLPLNIYTAYILIIIARKHNNPK